MPAPRFQVRSPDRFRGRSAGKLPVRIREVKVVDGDIMVVESDEAPKLPQGLTPQGDV